jgi:hypothetical protein
MTHHCGEQRSHRQDAGQERGRERSAHAAEEFAHRIARDAQKFGERVAEHASHFAREIAREWKHGPGYDTRPMAEDVRGMLGEVRSLVGDVIGGVDELIVRLFQQTGERPRREATPDESPATWARVVTNREVTCGGCGKKIGAGEDCHLRRDADIREFRCTDCGAPAADVPPQSPHAAS